MITLSIMVMGMFMLMRNWLVFIMMVVWDYLMREH